MRKFVVFWTLPALTVLVLLSGVARPETLRGEGERRNVSLLRMELPRGFYSDERVILANDFLSALHRTGHFDIVDREDMSAILEELKFQASDLADEEEVVELGGMESASTADYVVPGRRRFTTRCEFVGELPGE